MILKGSQRAGGMQLARHLLNTDENDHVTVHEVRGFISHDLHGAFKEAYAVSRGTRCKQFLFSLSLSPPETERVPIEIFEKAIDAIEERMKLANQPRAIVFHEKEGRRHAHCVWSRVDVENMRAIHLPHFKLKLQDISRQLYIENDWHMPRGLANSEERNPLNFTRAEWQQAKRLGRDPRKIKEVFQDCWAMSDGPNGFKNALEARGYYLAKGDRRGFVAVDWRGEVYAISRWTDKRTKEIKAKLGTPEQLPSVDEVKGTIAQKFEDRLRCFKSEIKQEFESARLGLKRKRDLLVARQKSERTDLKEKQGMRWNREAQQRADRFRKGIIGMWDWVTGRRSVIRKNNQEEIARAQSRDDAEMQILVERHLKERRELQQQIKSIRLRHENEQASMHEIASKKIDPIDELQNEEAVNRLRRTSRTKLDYTPF
ncbi:MAG: relaxase [Cyanobacteria bacterium P01_E01_bin.6]